MVNLKGIFKLEAHILLSYIKVPKVSLLLLSFSFSVSVQDYVLVVPESSYSSSYLNEEPLDKSYDFISNCGQTSFYIKSVSYSEQLTKAAVVSIWM